MDVISGLTYIDLIRNEPLVSTSLEVIPSSFLRDKPIPMSSWPTMAVAQPHRRKGSGGGAGWGANIRVDIKFLLGDGAGLGQLASSSHV